MARMRFKALSSSMFGKVSMKGLCEALLLGVGSTPVRQESHSMIHSCLMGERGGGVGMEPVDVLQQH